MASFYYNPQHHHPSSASPHQSGSQNTHGGRSRRAPRMSASHNPHKQFRGVRSPRDLIESPVFAAARHKFEIGRSFDMEDDLEFCPGLLTEDDLQSIHSSSTDGSVTSGSPQSSPLQPQIQPSQQIAPAFSLATMSNNNYNTLLAPQSNHHSSQGKIHQPAALRARKAIPIVNPNSRLPSPPTSVSPALVAHQSQQPTGFSRRMY